MKCETFYLNLRNILGVNPENKNAKLTSKYS